MDPEREQKLFTEYPHHIAMLVKAAQQAIKEGLIHIEGGKLVVNTEKTVGNDLEKGSKADEK